MKITKTKLELAAIICGTVIVLAVVAFSWASGEKISVSEVLESIFTFGAGALVALGLKKSAAAGTILIAFVGLQATACSPMSWETARSTIAGAEDALDSVEDLVPTDHEGWDIAVSEAHGALELGELAVDAWEASGDSGGWTKWVAPAVRAIAVVLAMIKDAGVEVPAPLLAAFSALQLIGAFV